MIPSCPPPPKASRACRTGRDMRLGTMREGPRDDRRAAPRASALRNGSAPAVDRAADVVADARLQREGELALGGLVVEEEALLEPPGRSLREHGQLRHALLRAGEHEGREGD